MKVKWKFSLKSIKAQLLPITLFFLGMTTVMAQESTITGTVTDSEGEPVPGASVVIKGTTSGVATDFDGNYSIDAIPEDVLAFSYIGYLGQEVTVGDQTNIDISLEEDVAKLEEVVVVGYGSQKKEEITSAITKVDSEEFNNGNVNNPSQLLQGKVAGLNIARPGSDPNQPFAIRLRGLSTFGANAEPLVVIDGIIGGSLNSVDPTDIESINVLKDAAAGAIYGTRGSSGVIIVTTKSGTGQAKAQLEYNAYAAVESLTNVIPVADREQFVSNGGLDLGSDTNWLDETTRNAITTVHNIAFTNSFGNGSSYRASLNYRDIQGVTRGTGREQLNGRINITQRLMDDRLKLTAIVSATETKADIGFPQAPRYALTFNPTAPVFENRSAADLGRDPDQFGGYFETGVQDIFNPVAIINLNQRQDDIRVLLMNFKADYEIISGLTSSFNFSRQTTTTLRGEFTPSTSLFNGGSGVNGRASRSTFDDKSTLAEFTTTYNTALGDFNLNLLGGYSYQQFDFQSMSASNTDFITNEVGYDNLGIGLGINNQQASVSSERNEAKLSAFLGRLNVNYKNAAFFSTSIRSEESSRFGANNRRGTFWAVSGGVNLGQIFELPSVDQLKFRLSYGVTGNEPPQRLEYLQRLGAVGQGYVNGEFVTAIGPVSNPNPDLKWEEKGEFNVGLDYAFFNSRLSGSVDYYIRNTTDLLNRVEVPSPPNINTTTILNLGELETKGFEFQFNWAAVDNDNFSWDFGGNFAAVNTVLVNLNDQENFIQFEGNLGAPGLAGIRPILVEEGAELGQIRAGIFAGYNDQGQSLIINQETGEPTTDRNIERDGVIVGNGLPNFTFGITNSLKYKNWDLNFLFRGAVGHSLVNIPRAYWEHPGLGGRQNFVVTKFFNPDDTELDTFSSNQVEKADFIRLDNATLGYNFNFGNSSPIDALRIYLAGNNLFTVTGYSGTDPEVRYSDVGPNNNSLLPSGNILVPGVDRRTTAFPVRTVTFGVNIKL